ncbi:N-6 DNA methylase [Corynebacterium pseudodiphtheriticum]|uniref:N-6 DNA methylase n=1 Tax=Corynebacterium pseudodiphtheriticum TaxID=37637 RepID=UPI002541904B|nr:N-6 DNA methylase [Corynebacterium pseudodiphtheriticum]MDK4286963.1 N-6 DNA methylase [Corynebacterium pseudodiphtheriticum]
MSTRPSSSHNAHTLKGLRADFKKVGKFHTPPALAKALSELIPGTPDRVYDPTCGAGALLEVFAGAEKYGQDIDAEALDDAEAKGVNIAHGDVLTSPAFMDQRFDAIVANPPFSIEWSPAPPGDPRFDALPTVPTKSKADYAFIAHIIHMLADGGTAAVLCFPGVAYRGGREQKIRAWMIEQNLIDRVIHIPGDTFVDTTISTIIMVIKKGRADAPIVFENREHDTQATATAEEIRANDYNLSPSSYAPAPEPEKEPFDAWAVQQQARRGIIKRLQADMRIDAMVCQFEGWDFEEHRRELIKTIRDFQPE